jgi:hypothetical protein
MVVARRSLFWPLAILVAVSSLLAALWYGPRLIDELGAAATPSCTVGLTGAAVSITIQGLRAQAQCDSYRGTTTDGGSWYVYAGSQGPTGAVICQENYQGNLLTVRDQGLLNAYGTSICKHLIDLINGAGAITTLPPVASIDPEDWVRTPFVEPTAPCPSELGWTLRVDDYWHCEAPDGTLIADPVFDQYLADMQSAAETVTSRDLCATAFPRFYWYSNNSTGPVGTCRSHQ